jgi:hypothetical protein
MRAREENLTLEDLLSDPLTRLVMQSDNITVADTAKAFAEARMALELRRTPQLFANTGRRFPWRACAGRTYRGV